MKTKDKILEKAVELFNEHGFFQVSTRQISQALGISPGNLTYHYRERRDLFMAIYERMHAEMEAKMAAAPHPETLDLRTVVSGFGQFIWRYRFFFQDLRSIGQEFPEVLTRHRKVVQRRLQQGEALIRALEQSGKIRLPSPETAPHLAHQIWFTSTFWFSQMPVCDPPSFAAPDQGLFAAIQHLLFPYQTPSS